jgi:hypothetical protein
LNQLSSLVSTISSYYSQKRNISIRDLRIVLSHIYDNFFFSIWKNLDRFTTTFANTYTRVNRFDLLILYFTALGIIVSLLFLMYYLYLLKDIKNRTGNILLLFLDIPRNEIKILLKRAEKFLLFCNVLLLEFLHRAGPI